MGRRRTHLDRQTHGEMFALEIWCVCVRQWHVSDRSRRHNLWDSGSPLEDFWFWFVHFFLRSNWSGSILRLWRDPHVQKKIWHHTLYAVFTEHICNSNKQHLWRLWRLSHCNDIKVRWNHRGHSGKHQICVWFKTSRGSDLKKGIMGQICTVSICMYNMYNVCV